MKLKLYTVFAVAVMGASVLTSCSDSGYWDESLPQGQCAAFPKPVYTVTLEEGQEVPATFEILMTRNNSGSEATIPVVASFSSPSLSGGSSVTFAAGSNTAVYVINVDPDIAGGSTFNAELTIGEDYYSGTDDEHASCLFTLNTALEWGDAGTAAVVSTWVGSFDPAVPVDVPVQVATNYAGTGKMYRLVSPYFYMEPEYAEEGSCIQFLLNDDYTPAAVTPRFQTIGEYDSSAGDFAFAWFADGSYGSSFTKDGNTYTISGLMCYNQGTSGWYPYTSEIISFTWTEGYPGN